MVKKRPAKKRIRRLMHFHPLGAALGSGFITGVTSHIFNLFILIAVMVVSFATLVYLLGLERNVPMVFSKKV